MKPDFILAIGAGSVFDAAKAVACGIAGADMFKVEADLTPLKIVGVLLASGTGSECTWYCRVTDVAL